MPKGFKRIRYYGVQATKTFTKVKVAIQAALAKVEGVVKGAVKIIARLTYRQRYEQSTGRDPCICPHCQSKAASSPCLRPGSTLALRGRGFNPALDQGDAHAPLEPQHKVPRPNGRGLNG